MREVIRMELLTESKRALRGVLSRPGFTATTLAALGLGIGLNTAIFSLVHAVLLRSLPYREPDRIVRVWESRPPPQGFGEPRRNPKGEGGPRMGGGSAEVAAFSMDHFRAWRESTDVFESMAVYQDRSFNLTGGSEPLRVEAQSVSPALFSLLGVEPLLGRAFTAEEETPGGDRVALLSYGLWQRVFGGDETIVGRTVRLDGGPYDVVGVMPRTFRFPQPAVELWVPLPDVDPEPLPPGAIRIELVPVVAKLAPGVSVEQAEAAGQAFLDRYRRTSDAPPEFEREVAIHLTSLQEQLARPIRPALLVLFVAVTFVLLIVCANVANLFLTRAQGRETEMALRAALGAGRSRLARQLLAESLAYALAGGALAIVVAALCLRFVRLTLPSSPWLEEVALDGPVVAFNLGVALLTALLVGLLPAIRASQVDVVSGLRGSAGSGPRGRPSRNALAVAEVALALVLFAAAGLMLRSFMNLARNDPGYEPRDVLTFRLSLPETKYPDGAARRAFFDALRERLSALSGVSASGLVTTLPLDQERMITFLDIEGRPRPADRMRMPRASVRIVSPDFFRAMGIRLTSGRALDEGDQVGAPPVVVVNESLARRYFEGEDPLEARIHRMGAIIGVVSDFRQEGLDRDPEPEIYFDYRQAPDAMSEAISRMSVAVRYDPRTSGLVESVKAAIHGLDPELPLADVRTMEARLEESVARPRLYALLLSFFAGVALVIAVSGVASVVSYQASARTRENGLRMALGATPREILGLSLKDGWRILAFGLFFGLAGALFVGRMLSSVLFEVSPFDPWTLSSVCLVLGTATIAASAIPARRAARMDPVTALRYE
jgi:putative ABC transport system permease protein